MGSPKYMINPTQRISAVPKMDPTTHASIVAGTWLMNLHEGRSFIVFQSTNDLNDNPLKFLFTTPAVSIDQKRLIHFSMFFAAIDEFTVTFIEDAVGSSGGSLLYHVNRNRQEIHSSLLGPNLYGGASIVDPTDGTYLGLLDYGALSGGLFTSGNVVEERFILKADSVYFLSLTGVNNNNRAHLGFNWAEQENQEFYVPAGRESV